MKSILMSVKPEWVEKIFSGEKIMEFRKTIPNCKLPCKYYIYCTKNRHLACVVNKSGAELFYTCNNETAVVIGGYLANGNVVGEFTLNYWRKFRIVDNICQWLEESDWTRYYEKQSELRSIKDGRVPFDQLKKYLNGKDGYALYIDDLKKYDQPKELSEFGLTKAPQSWCYVEEL